MTPEGDLWHPHEREPCFVHKEMRSELKAYCQEQDLEATGLKSCLMLLVFPGKHTLWVPCYDKHSIMWTVHLHPGPYSPLHCSGFPST